MTITATRLLTADDLLRLYSQGVRGELIQGVLHETTPTGYAHGKIVVNLSAELRYFVKNRKLGSLTASDSGVWLERDPDTVREPDIAYFSAAKIPLGAMDTGNAEVAPDLVVEIASPATASARSATRRRCGCGTVWTWCGSCSRTRAPWTCISQAAQW